ncbi:MAG: MFS transporter, partial [Bacteroidota bacterium]
MTDSSHKTPLAAVSIPAFRNFIAGRFLFIMSLRMMGTLVGWWIYELTGDPLALGFIGLSEVVPAVSLALFAGHVVDLSDRKKMIVRSTLAYIVCLLVLSGIYFLSNIHLSGKVLTISVIFIVIFFTGVIRSFSGPSFGASIGQMVPAELLSNAATWSQGSWLMASVIGHASVGFMIAFLGMQTALLIILSICIISLIIFHQLPSMPPPPAAEAKTWERVKEGIRFVWQTKTLLAAMTLDLFAILLGGAVAMLPVFAKDILKVGPVGFGWLNAASDIGSIFIVTILMILPLSRNQGKILILSVFGFGASIVLFGLSAYYWLSLIALAVSGAVDNISVVIRHVLVQMKTPDGLRGRTTAVNSVFIECSNELGAFESGLVAAWFGPVVSVVSGGFGTLGVVAIVAVLFPALRRMRRLVESRDEMRKDVREAEFEEEEHRRLGPE